MIKNLYSHDDELNMPMDGDDYSALAKDEYELYNECHRLFSYDSETGILTRKMTVDSKALIDSKVGSLEKSGYLRVCIKYKFYRVHRIIWLMQTGSFPKEHIDHVNGIKNDNIWSNLRQANHSENARNRGKPSNNTSGFKGVVFSGSKKNPYKAQIFTNGIYIYLGLFPSLELAIKARLKASQKYHGKFSDIEQNKFDELARQVARNISKQYGISIKEAETLKQWLTNFIQDNLRNEEIQL